MFNSQKWLRLTFLITFLFGFLWGFPVMSDQGPDTGQIRCFDNEDVIPCPNQEEPFYGQDAQYSPRIVPIQSLGITESSCKNLPPRMRGGL